MEDERQVNLMESEGLDAQTTEETVAISLAEEVVENAESVLMQNETCDAQAEEVESEQAEEIAEEVQTEEVQTEEVQTEEVQAEVQEDDGLTEDERLAVELERVNAELRDLDEQIEGTEVRVAVHNLFDTQEGADEVGISGEYDDYGREILDDVFENRLRMSTNGIKLAYSKIKNTFLSHKGTKQYYDGLAERFSLERERLMSVEIGGDTLYVYLKAEPSMVGEYCPYVEPIDKTHKDYSVCVAIKRGKITKKTAELQKLVELVEKFLESKGGVKKKVYVPIPYAERYPVNPEAVLRGSESETPVDGAYDGEEYDPIDNELTRNIIIDLMGEEFDLEKKKGLQKLEALRQQAETIRGAVALTEPVVYFYDCGLNSDSTINYLGVQQVLNDKFLGKILPPQYVAIAENSERIEELNLIALQSLLEEIKENPKYVFALPMSCRTFARKGSHAKLVKMLEGGVERLVVILDGNMLLSLGKVGIDGVDELRGYGIKIMIDYGVDTGVHMLTDYPVDYLRIDARYYKESDVRRTALLDMLVGYCKVQGITTVASGVEETKQAKYFLTHGVDVIEGFCTGEPKRTVASAVKEYKKLPLVSN
ncbi:MAG: EAL domain-containing protein [Clostridia bacterium]|nr:EAL domain-containing protein [Clostridia bacterium]